MKAPLGITAFALGAAASAVLATTVHAAADTTGAVWLDAKPLVDWNVASAPLPKAPAPRGDSPTTARCVGESRAPETADDRAVGAQGWTLFGPYELYSGTSLVFGMASVDGMCRPLQFQAFVFVNGLFAGTLSPEPMNSRTDGTLQPLELFSPTDLNAQFGRYTASDPLCCPSRTTSVTFRIERRNGKPVVVPLEAASFPNR